VGTRATRTRQTAAEVVDAEPTDTPDDGVAAPGHVPTAEGGAAPLQDPADAPVFTPSSFVDGTANPEEPAPVTDTTPPADAVVLQVRSADQAVIVRAVNKAIKLGAGLTVRPATGDGRHELDITGLPLLDAARVARVVPEGDLI
jgi:hypothetical protein